MVVVPGGGGGGGGKQEVGSSRSTCGLGLTAGAGRHCYGEAPPGAPAALQAPSSPRAKSAS